MVTIPIDLTGDWWLPLDFVLTKEISEISSGFPEKIFLSSLTNKTCKGESPFAPAPPAGWTLLMCEDPMVGAGAALLWARVKGGGFAHTLMVSEWKRKKFNHYHKRAWQLLHHRKLLRLSPVFCQLTLNFTSHQLQKMLFCYKHHKNIA